MKFICAFFIALEAHGFVQAEEPPRPHVVFLLADDLGWKDVGFHGSRIRTPHIDALAERGVQLNQFYVQPVCSPTRAALMTGRYPMRYGLQCGVVRPWAKHGLPPKERTLPSALKEAGYTTAVVGKWHLGHSAKRFLPLQRGFDLQYGHYNGALDYFTHDRDGGHDWHRNDTANYDKGYTTDLIADEAVRIISRHDVTKPLFLYVPFNAPHTPLQAPEESIEAYARIPNKQRRIYAAMVSRMDEGVGRIVKALKDHKFTSANTVIFFCSDNGGVLRFGSNAPLRSGKSTLYEGGVRVPAVAVWDGVLKAGDVIDEPLHIVDVYPTLLKLAGVSLDQPLPLDGKDASQTLLGKAPTPHKFILHNLSPFHGAIRGGDWKLIHNGQVKANDTKASDTEQWELFNINQDESESRDMKEKEPKVFARLKSKLEALAKEASRPRIPANRRPRDFQVPKVWGE